MSEAKGGGMTHRVPTPPDFAPLIRATVVVGAHVDADCLADFRFSIFFYSLEGSEPPHVHVERADNLAKFWLQPVSLAESYGFRSHVITELRALVIEHRLSLLEA